MIIQTLVGFYIASSKVHYDLKRPLKLYLVYNSLEKVDDYGNYSCTTTIVYTSRVLVSTTIMQ